MSERNNRQNINPQAQKAVKEIENRYRSVLQDDEYILVWSPRVGHVVVLNQKALNKLNNGEYRAKDHLACLGMGLASCQLVFQQTAQLAYAESQMPYIVKPPVISEEES